LLFEEILWDRLRWGRGFVWQKEGPIDVASAVHVLGGGLTISLSVIMGLPPFGRLVALHPALSRTKLKII